MLCEWSKLLIISEESFNSCSEKFGLISDDECLKLLPLSFNNLDVIIEKLDMKDEFAYTQFLRFVHLRVGDIMRYLVCFVNEKL